MPKYTSLCRITDIHGLDSSTYWIISWVGFGRIMGYMFWIALDWILAQ